MFDKPLDVANLSEEQRQKLDELYEIRGEMAMRNIETYRLKRAVVQNPCIETEDALEEYLRIFVQPLALRASAITTQLQKDVFSKDKLVSMLPVILTLVTQVVDVRLFLELLELDVDSGHPVYKLLEQAMSRDIPTD